MPFDDVDESFFQSPPDADVGERPDDGPIMHRVPPRLGLLAQLDTDEFDAVARAAKLTFLSAGTVVFEQGEVADRFHIVIDGSVSVTRDGEHLATLGPGSFFGESAIFVRGRRSATVTTESETTVWSIDLAAFDEALSHHLLADEAARAEAARRIAATPAASFRAALDSDARTS